MVRQIGTRAILTGGTYYGINFTVLILALKMI